MKCLKVVLSAIVIAALVVSASAYDCIVTHNKFFKTGKTSTSAGSESDCEGCIAGYVAASSGSTVKCDFDSKSCVATANLFDEGTAPSQKCSCMAGYKRELETGACIFDDTLCKAEANAEVKGSGLTAACGCKDKYVRQKSGKCEAATVHTDISLNYPVSNKVANANGDGWVCRKGFKQTTAGDACEKVDPITEPVCTELGRKFEGTTCKTECKEATHKPAKGHPVGRCYPKAEKCVKENRDKVDDLCLCKAGFIAEKDDTFGTDEACVSGAVVSMILSTSAVLVSVVGAIALLM